MELTIAITVLCICLSILLTPCASLQPHKVQSSLGQEASSEPEQLSPPALLPRKLRLFEEVKVEGHENQDSSSTHNKQKQEDLTSGKAHEKEQNVVRGTKGTHQEWVEGSDTSQYFTMDYSHVRRRRPIHNKSVPLSP